MGVWKNLLGYMGAQVDKTGVVSPNTKFLPSYEIHREILVGELMDKYQKRYSCHQSVLQGSIHYCDTTIHN